jgi:hypothetical protein
MIKLRLKISENQAKKLVFSFVRYGDHSNRKHTDSLNNKQVQEWFKQNGHDFQSIIDIARNHNEILPLVEGNLLSSVSHILCSTDNGVKTQVIRDNKIQTEILGKGMIDTQVYQSKFESSIDYKDLAIKKCNFEHLLTAISKAVASIEAYFHMKSQSYNDKILHPTDKLIDSREKPISLEDKFTIWIPKMTKKNFDRSTKSWCLFKQQLDLRNNYDIHSKNISHSISYSDLVGRINSFRDGICRILYDLHIAFGDQMFRKLIRSIYAPDVY